MTFPILFKGFSLLIIASELNLAELLPRAPKVLLCSSSRHRGEPQLGFAALGAALPLAQNDVQVIQTGERGGG